LPGNYLAAQLVPLRPRISLEVLRAQVSKLVVLSTRDFATWSSYNMICLEDRLKICCAEDPRIESTREGVPIRSRFWRLGFLAILLAIGHATAASAVTTIDDFVDDQFVQAAGADGTPGSDNATNAAIIGLNRSVFIQKTGGSTKLTKAIKVDVDSSISTFTLSRDAGIDGQGLVQWDGGLVPASSLDPRSNLSFQLGGGAGVNLTTGGSLGILVRVTEADIAGQQLRFTLFGANNTIASDAVVNVPVIVGPPQLIQIPWASFTQTLIANGAVFNASAAANPNQVFAITMGITGPDDADVSLDFVSTYVPEPASAVLLGIGGIACLARFNRKRFREIRQT